MTTPIVYSKVSQDIANETQIDQRFIGLLDQNRTRLNVNSALTRRDDQQDVYRFRVTRGGKLGLSHSVLVNKEIKMDMRENIRVEILDRSGRTIADSKATSGSQKDNYMKALADGLEVKNGDYYIRVTRDRARPRNEVIEYSFQIRNGSYREDFDTVERPPVTQVQANASLVGTSAMTTMLNNSRTSGMLGENNLFSTLRTLV